MKNETYHISNWRVVFGQNLWGYRDEDVGTGTCREFNGVVTSPIVSALGNVVRTFSGSTYVLGEPFSEEEWKNLEELKQELALQ